MNEERCVRCDSCGCAFEPKAMTERVGDIEYTFFRGKPTWSL